MYFRQFWTDERLNFESKGAPAKVDRLAAAVLKTKVWVPDPFFANQVFDDFCVKIVTKEVTTFSFVL